MGRNEGEERQEKLIQKGRSGFVTSNGLPADQSELLPQSIRDEKLIERALKGVRKRNSDK